MASSHVPNDQLPLQGQTLYADPSYHDHNHNLFSVDRYGTPTWDAQQLHQQQQLHPSPQPQSQSQPLSHPQPQTQNQSIPQQHHQQQQPQLAPNGSSSAWHHGAFPQQSYNPSYGTQTHSYPAASPYQYGQFGQQPSTGNFAQPSNVDPALGLDPNALRQQQQSPYQMPVRNTTPQSHPDTVTPQALLHSAPHVQTIRPSASPFQIPRTTSEMFAQRVAPAVKPVPVPTYDIPRGKKSGGLYVLDQSTLATATNSTALNKLVTLGSAPFHLATNRTALPVYTARQSVRDLKRVGADNKKLLAKLSSSKPSAAKALKSRTYAGSPSTVTKQISDSESYDDSSDDSSEYTDDEDEEPSPLPAARPDEPHEAVRFDIIKATWFPRRTPLTSEKIKDSMRDIWEVLNTIQKRWRADSKAVTEAEDQKKTGELPVLKSRVTSQRDLLQSALKAALDHAHPDVLYHLGQIKPFLYLCYQFLANRFHAKDFDGSLPAVIFEILSRCGTLTSELLEDTKVIKALTSMKKHANDKHKAFIQQIVDGAVANTKKAKATSPPRSEAADVKGVKRPATEAATRSAGDVLASKKLKLADGVVTAVKKTVPAPSATKTTTATAAGAQTLKRPGEKPATGPTPVKARVSQITNKPSGLFASLNAAASKKPTPVATPTTAKPTTQAKATVVASKDKKPIAAPKNAFSFAQTMASLLKPKEPEVAPVKAEKQLPPETPEEKAKRLRKEARRHLRVTFKPDASLVAIKYFHHDPDEELGHEENFVRDAGDIGGEGRMFKQHKELEEDDDDEDVEVESKPWNVLSQVDFSVVPSSERERNYEQFGGGQQVPSCPELEANIKRENATLMVFYADPQDIPPSPREPLEQEQQSAPAVTVTTFGMPPAAVLSRCPASATPAPAVALPDLSSLENIFKQFANPTANETQPAPQPAPASVQNTYAAPPYVAPTASATPDLASILSALQGPPAMPTQSPAPFPMQPAAPQGPAPGMDLAAIMSALQGSGMALPPPPPGFPPFPMPFAMPPQQQQHPQQDNMGYQNQTQLQYGQHVNGGTKRPREESNNIDRGLGKKHKNRGERPHKVLPCKFYQKGTCNKGDNCTYVHDLNM